MQATYVNHYLTDRDIANFARQSFATVADQFTEQQNNNLIRFLARGMTSGDWEKTIGQMHTLPSEKAAHNLAVYMRSIPEHWVPFGHPQITLRMKAPVPIRTQCFKHKIGFVESEESRRYIKSTPELYIPDAFRSAAASVKQGSGDEHPHSEGWKTLYIAMCESAIGVYGDMLADGVCPEQARFVLPQGTEVNWVWTGSLYAFAQAYNKRSDSHAQKEVQGLFAEIDAIISPLYPVAWAALTRGEY
jgi:thymidylate synthase (FAD)